MTERYVQTTRIVISTTPHLPDGREAPTSKAQGGPSVLMAPLHYRVGPSVGGSELSWAYEIFMQVRRHARQLDAIVADAPGVLADGHSRVYETSAGTRQNYFTSSIRPRLAFMMQYWSCARKLLQEERYDVLHHVLPWSTNTFNPIILSRGLPMGLDPSTRVVVGPYHGVHEIQFDDEAVYNRFSNQIDPVKLSRAPGRPLLERGATLLHERTMRKADRVIALTNDAKASLARYVDLERICVIPAGIDSSRFPLTERSALTGQLTLVSASYFLKRKGIEYILRAVAQLLRSGHNTRLILGGDGPQLDALQSEARGLGIVEHVEFRGLLSPEQLIDLYSEGDLFVSMSWAETFGVAMLEAMSTGLPVVSADNVGARQIVIDGETGFLTSRGDAESLAAVLTRYFENSHLARRQGDAAAQAVRDRYNWDTIGGLYARVYDEVLSN